MSKRFYIVQVHSGCEDSVKKMILQKVSLNKSLQKDFGEILIPIQKVVELREGQKVTVERKIYPGYIIVEMAMNDSNWNLVKSINKVGAFVGGSSGKPSALSTKELDKMLNKVAEGEVKPKHKIIFESGEVVRIIDGPFADYTGVIHAVDHEEATVKMHVNILGRETPLQLSFSQVEKA